MCKFKYTYFKNNIRCIARNAIQALKALELPGEDLNDSEE